jgi:hypothetical protein
MYYIVCCTYGEMYISDLKKKLSKMFHKYSELNLLTSSPQAGHGKKSKANHIPCTTTAAPHCRLLPERVIPVISDLRLHHIPEDFDQKLTLR